MKRSIFAAKRCAPLFSMLLAASTAYAQEPSPAPTDTTAAPAAGAPAEATPPATATDAPPAEAPVEATTLSADTTVAADPAAAEGEVQLSQAELEALGFGTTESGAASTLDTDLHVSGFADFSAAKAFNATGSTFNLVTNKHTSFYVGNFNLYLTKNLTESIRMMGEVRFLYLPNGGPPLAGENGRVPVSSAQDYNDSNQSLKWGGIEIERVYLEWQAHRYLTIRTGQFLTPYGIWNVDHGSPTFIPVQRPYVVGGTLFPERQTGFELYGRWDATNSGTLGYHFTLSNGTGPVSEYKDLDGNRAVGGRLFWNQLAFGELRVGASFYYGLDSDGYVAAVPQPDGTLRTHDEFNSKSKVLSLAADVVWKYKGLLLQAEYVSQQREYFHDGGRDVIKNPITQTTVFPPDSANWGMYALAGYRTPWWGIMPYLIYSSMNLKGATGVHTATQSLNAGLNIRAVDAVVVKLEFQYAKFREKLYNSDDPWRLLVAQVAWAF